MCNFIKKEPDFNVPILAGAPIESQLTPKTAYFNSTTETIDAGTNIEEFFNRMTALLLEAIEQFQNESSGWIFNRVEYFYIHVDTLDPS